MEITEEIKNNILDVVRKDSQREERYQLEPDGWEIMEPEYFLKMGFHPGLIESLVSRQYSGEGKYALTDNNGKPTEYVDGVYYLHLLENCARIVNPTYSCDKMGRGWRARAALDALKEAANES